MLNLTEKSHRDWKDGLHAWQKLLSSDGAAAGKSTAMPAEKGRKSMGAHVNVGLVIAPFAINC
jgi:hypothetical protein